MGPENMSNAAGELLDLSVILPEGCIANVLSLTSPQDACRLSLVAYAFRSAAESDVVWERFLPSDYKDIIARAVDPTSTLAHFASKKQFYFWLSDHPLIIDQGTKSFSVEKRSGRRCYMLAAKDLSIVWGDTPTYWRWISLPESRFSEVAELACVCWLEIHGKMDTRMLSPNTTYAAYLVFKATSKAYGFEYQPAEVAFGISGGNIETRSVYLDPDGGQIERHQIIPRRIGLFRPTTNYTFREHVSVPRENDDRYPKVRGDGWMEIELGNYFHAGREDGELEMSLMEVKGGNWKSGLIVQGIEIRPKEDK